MTTLTEDPPVEPTSAHAEITHLAQRQRLATMVPVLASLTADATHHLPFIGHWDQSVSYRGGLDDKGITGQVQSSGSTEAAVLWGVAQWADYLGTEVQQEKLRHAAHVTKVWCEVVIEGVRVEIWDHFADIPETTEALR